MHLLVVEDERILCETIVRSLRRLAYSVDYCSDGETALELLGVERYDLCLLYTSLAAGTDGAGDFGVCARSGALLRH